MSPTRAFVRNLRSAAPLAYALSTPVVRRNLVIAGLVGCVLSLTNQYNVIAANGVSLILALKLATNFLIPFTVSTVSAAVNSRGQ